MSETATIWLDGTKHELPVVVGSEGEKGIDITRLREKTGYITLDPGYVNTGSCASEICFLDGLKGILRYRGIPIEQLAEKSNFLETAYLLINNKLPTKEEFETFQDNITRHTMIHEDMKRFYDGFPKDAHPMAILSSVISGLSTFYQDTLYPFDLEKVELSILRLIAKVPTIAAYSYNKSIGQPLLYPDNSLDYCSNFLHMMFSVPPEKFKADPIFSKALNLLFILHADHEQNCSTSTVRLVGSSHANLFASISTGVSALWGPLHGGANQMVIEMLETIQNDDGNVDKYIAMAKDKNHPFRLYGFGHRVYKNFDPRAKIIKKACDELLEKIGISDPLLDVAKQVEEIALNDDYFVSRKLYPNVDFYSGIIYKALGFPVNMFTVLFAIGRLPGWISQWKEMIFDPKQKLSRPRQIYLGESETPYVDIEKR
ncbi:MAG: citrate synthase [Nitrospinota bacterium]